MDNSKKNLEFKLERTIPAPVTEVFDGWLDPKIPGNPWNAAEKFLLDPKVDGLFFWALKGASHYGRFTAIERPARIQHTWVSPKTLGTESTVTVTFKKKGDETLMTLVHNDLPDHELARWHEKGWNYFLEIFSGQFGNGSRKIERPDAPFIAAVSHAWPMVVSNLKSLLETGDVALIDRPRQTN